ncbi:cytoskeleton-associated protein 2 [Phycodurus eques]|uniref:cytoskeleton-associated protein 2 n=1 Tax=Phycodurus eques TaxID=693459 RepID=UPI002ACE827F|nr:cytoskeleton-associated protein 2 [Phycodurus eques]XP_061558527.1 cytoskeleton-associated protein 2 [Phycodurus eques]
MSNTAVSRKPTANRKGNKENAHPGDGIKSFSKRDFSKSTSAVSVQLKSNKKREMLVRNGASKIASKIQDAQSVSGEVLKKVKFTQKDGNGSAVSEVKQRQARNLAVLAEQTVKNGKLVTYTPGGAGAAPSKAAPGMYKGKIVESKIGSIWKLSARARGAVSKPAAPEAENRSVANLARSRSKSVTDVPERGFQKPRPPRSKSVVDGRAQAFKPVATGRPPGPRSAHDLSTAVIPATIRTTGSGNPTVAPTKPKISITDKKVKKPPVTSTLSQYRNTETAEERRAKLAVWLASKGKTLKRPAMTSARPEVKRSASVNPKAGVKSQRDEAKSEPELALSQCKQNPAVSAPDPEAQEAPATVQTQTPVMLNTTLDLVENPDLDLPVLQDGFEGIAVNLCDALEALQTPSKYKDKSARVCDDAEQEEGPMENERVKDLFKNENVKELLKNDNGGSEQGVQMDEKVQCDGDDNIADMEGVSQMGHAFVIKYSVKTTPYLQSVKKTIESEVQTSAARRKSNIKDLKFLTPVRRSRRIERHSSCLPPTLLDHDPCVSSLAELVKLDDDLNAYVYRKNSALVEDLPDQVIT